MTSATFYFDICYDEPVSIDDILNQETEGGGAGGSLAPIKPLTEADREILRRELAAYGISLPSTMGDMQAAAVRIHTLRENINKQIIQLNQLLEQPFSYSERLGATSAPGVEGNIVGGRDATVKAEIAAKVEKLEGLKGELNGTIGSFQNYIGEYVENQLAAERKKGIKAIQPLGIEEREVLRANLAGLGYRLPVTLDDVANTNARISKLMEDMMTQKQNLLASGAVRIGADGEMIDATGADPEQIKKFTELQRQLTSTRELFNTYTTEVLRSPEGQKALLGRNNTIAPGAPGIPAAAYPNGATAAQMILPPSRSPIMGAQRPSTEPDVPSADEFMAEFNNAWATYATGLGDQLSTSESRFMNDQVRGLAMQQYTAALGRIAQRGRSPFYRAGGQPVGGQTFGGGGGGSSAGALLPRIMPLDFLQQTFKPSTIKILYEGSAQGAGQGSGGVAPGTRTI